MHSIQDIRLFQTGDNESFEKLASAEGPRMLSYINRYVLSMDEAEDIFQETWIRVWNSREKLRKPNSFRSWIYQICRTAIYDHNIKNVYKMEISVELKDDSELLSDHHENVRDKVQEMEWKKIIKGVMAELDNESREIIVMRFENGLKQREIAEVLNLPLGSVGFIIKQSISKFRDKLLEQGITKFDW